MAGWKRRQLHPRLATRADRDAQLSEAPPADGSSGRASAGGQDTELMRALRRQLEKAEGPCKCTPRRAGEVQDAADRSLANPRTAGSAAGVGADAGPSGCNTHEQFEDPHAAGPTLIGEGHQLEDSDGGDAGKPPRPRITVGLKSEGPLKLGCTVTVGHALGSQPANVDGGDAGLTLEPSRTAELLPEEPLRPGSAAKARRAQGAGSPRAVPPRCSSCKWRLGGFFLRRRRRPCAGAAPPLPQRAPGRGEPAPAVAKLPDVLGSRRTAVGIAGPSEGDCRDAGVAASLAMEAARLAQSLAAMHAKAPVLTAMLQAWPVLLKVAVNNSALTGAPLLPPEIQRQHVSPGGLYAASLSEEPPRDTKCGRSVVRGPSGELLAAKSIWPETGRTTTAATQGGCRLQRRPRRPQPRHFPGAA